MNDFDFDKDREENPLFYELVGLNYQRAKKHPFRGHLIRNEGKENGKSNLPMVLVGEELEDKLRGDEILLDSLDFRTIEEIEEEHDSFGEFLKYAAKMQDGAVIIEDGLVSEPVLLYAVPRFKEAHQETYGAEEDFDLAEALDPYLHNSLITGNGGVENCFGNEVSTGRRVGNKTRTGLALALLYPESKVYINKNTARGGLNTGPVVMFGKHGLERMCFFDQKNYEGGVTGFVSTYEFDTESGEVVRTGTYEFDPRVLGAEKSPSRLTPQEDVEKYS